MAEVSAGVDLAPVRLVDPDGSPTAEDRYSRDLPPETLSWLYDLMVVTRDIDGEFVNLQRQGELALFASCRGQEAAQIGAAACLRKTDWLFPQYREIGAFLLRGITPAQMGAVWRGKWHGGLGFTEKCVAPIAIPIGTHGLHAVGAAMGAQRLGEDSVTLAYLGDGATSEGDAHEALNFAAVYKAPCVFFIQNNQWAISVPVSHQMAGPSIAHRAVDGPAIWWLTGTEMAHWLLLDEEHTRCLVHRREVECFVRVALASLRRHRDQPVSPSPRPAAARPSPRPLRAIRGCR